MRKETRKDATCPFCGLLIERPRELITHKPQEMPLGSCSCGAVYAYDATGHNLGAAFVEALVFACDMDWELAWGLSPEEDYAVSLVERYDVETHAVVPGGTFEGRRIAGGLYFVRLHQDIREVTHDGVRKRLARAAPAEAPAAPATAAPLTKQQVDELVRANQLEPLLQAAWQDKKVVRHLQRLLCAPDALTRFRAAEFLGRVCLVVAQKDATAVANLLQGLATSFAYSAASNWGAIDAIGEIISSAPNRYAGYIAALFHLMKDDALRPQVVRTLGRIAQVRPDLVSQAVPRLLTCLNDSDFRTRGYAAWVLGILAASEARHGLTAYIGELLAGLADQEGELEFYEAGQVVRKTVGQVAAQALAGIN